MPRMSRKQIMEVQDGIITVLLTIIGFCIVMFIMWASAILS